MNCIFNVQGFRPQSTSRTDLFCFIALGSVILSAPLLFRVLNLEFTHTDSIECAEPRGPNTERVLGVILTGISLKKED